MAEINGTAAAGAEPALLIFKLAKSQPGWLDHVCDTFIGREKLLRTLELSLEVQGGHNHVALWGLSGIGKFTVALEYVDRLLSREPTSLAFLIRAENRDSLLSNTRQVGGSTESAKSVKDVKTWLETQHERNWLILMNKGNRENRFLHEVIRTLIPFSPHGRVIFPARDEQKANDLVHRQYVKQFGWFNCLDAQNLFLSSIGRFESLKDNDPDICRLLQTIDYHTASTPPLRTHFLASFLSLPECLRRQHSIQDKHLRTVLEMQSMPTTSDMFDNSMCLVKALTNSFQQLQQFAAPCADLLSFMSCLSYERIPEELLAASDHLRISEEICSAALILLKRHDFVFPEKNGRFFRVHRLVRHVVIEFLKLHGSFPRWMDAAFRQIDKIYPYKMDNSKSISVSHEEYSPHIEAVLSFEMVSRQDLVSRAALAHRYARFLLQTGNYSHSLHFSDKAIQWQTSSCANDLEKSLHYRSSKALILRHDGQFERARLIDKEVFAQWQGFRGRKDRETITALSALGCDLDGLGRYEEARKLHERAMYLSKKHLGRHDPDTLFVMACLCHTLVSMKYYELAEEVGKEVYNIKDRLFGRENNSTMTSLESLGTILRMQEEYGLAESIYTEVLRVRKLLNGNRDPSVLTAMGNVVCALDDRGQLPEATKMMREVLELSNEIKGPKHHDSMRCRNNLAEALLQLAKFDEAESLKREVIEYRRAKFGRAHPDTRAAENGLERILDARRSVEARNLLQNLRRPDPYEFQTLQD